MKRKENLKQSMYCFVILIMLFQNAIYAHNRCSTSSLADSLDLILEEFSIQNNIKGLSASINLGERNIWKGTYGVSHESVEIRRNTLFGIGSITKSFTSAIILQLYEEGKLNLNDPVSKWIAPHDKIDGAITIEQLLTHTSGIYNYTNNPAIFGPVITYPDKYWTLEDILPYLNDPGFEPGEGYEYSNTNYYILGVIIEKITGKPYYHELKKRILRPLRLKRTSLYMQSKYLDDLSHVWAYDGSTHTDNSSWNNTTSMFSFAWSAGGIVSTARELTNYGTALLHSNFLLNDTTMYKMKNEEQPGYGYGIEVSTYTRNGESTKAYGHYGNIGFMSGLIYVPEDSLTIGVVCNQNNDVYTNLIPLLYKAVIDYAADEHHQPVKHKNLTGESLASNTIGVYPNPASDVLYISNVNGGGENLTYSIHDRTGRLMRKGILSSNSIQISDLDTGLYILTVEQNASVYTNRFIVL